MTENIHAAIDAAMRFDADAMLEATLALEYDPERMDCELRTFASAAFGAQQLAETVIRWRESGDLPARPIGRFTP